jgi:dihydrofolate reductase
MKVTVFMGASVDGFIARPDGTLDFLPAEPEPHGYEELMASVDALVFGRHTYETVLGFGGEWPYGEKPVFVLSSRALPPPPAGAVVTHLSGEPAAIVAELESRGIVHAYLDGGIAAQRFLRAGLVQRLVVTRVPVLIGSGIPLFGGLPHDVRLRHVATRSFPSGLVQSEYAIDPD